MVNATFVTDAQRRVPKTACPVCQEPRLEFSLRCDMADHECLFLARCAHCNTTFDLDPDSFPPNLTEDSLEGGNIVCPDCEGHMAMVTISCSTSSYRCQYALKCPTCDH